MKELVFALQFNGKARPVEGVEGKLAAKTTAAGQVLRTALTAKGVKPRRKRDRPLAPHLSQATTGRGARLLKGAAGRPTPARRAGLFG